MNKNITNQKFLLVSGSLFLLSLGIANVASAAAASDRDTLTTPYTVLDESELEQSDDPVDIASLPTKSLTTVPLPEDSSTNKGMGSAAASINQDSDSEPETSPYSDSDIEVNVIDIDKIKKETKAEQSRQERKRVAKEAVTLLPYAAAGLASWYFAGDQFDAKTLLNPANMLGGVALWPVIKQTPIVSRAISAADYLGGSLGLKHNKRHMNQEKYNEFEMQFKEREHLYTPENRAAVKKILSDLQTQIDKLDQKHMFDDGDEDRYQKRQDHADCPGLINRLKEIFKQPHAPAPFKATEESMADIEKHLATYPADTQRAVLDIITNANSGKKSYYFRGDPSTGKTETAKAIATALNRPFYEINPMNGSLLGSAERKGRSADGELHYGQIAKAMATPYYKTGQPCTNPVIFIDEVHDVLNSAGRQRDSLYSELKKVTDPDRKIIKDEVLGIEIDISKPIIICAGNAKLRDEKGALNDRFTEIKFKHADQEVKTAVAVKELRRTAQVEEVDITEEDEAKFKTQIDKMAEQKAKHQAKPSIRSLKIKAGGYVAKKKRNALLEKMGKHVEETDDEASSTDEEVGAMAGKRMSHEEKFEMMDELDGMGEF